MIGLLNGTVSEIDGNEIIVDTGGVGYLVTVGNNFLLGENIKVGREITLSIFTVVKEDEIRLFGFKDYHTRRLFKTLLSVNGVGPKMAQAITDQIKAEDVIGAIELNDYSTLVRVPGVGKKTAQRIVVDLNGKIDQLNWKFTNNRTNDVDGGEGRGDGLQINNLYEDAKSALVNLGFGEKEVTLALRKYVNIDISIDDVIRKSLGELNKKEK